MPFSVAKRFHDPNIKQIMQWVNSNVGKGASESENIWKFVRILLSYDEVLEISVGMV